MSPKVSDDYLDARRREIIDAAVRCFSQYGFHDATLERIRDQAGLSRGAVYHYFKSKEDIIDAIRAATSEDDQPLIAAFSTAPNAAAGLRALVQVVLDRMTQPTSADANRVGIMLWSEALFNERIHESQLRTMHDGAWPIEELIREGQVDGSINANLDPRATADFILAAIMGIQIRLMWEPDINVDAMGRALIAMLTGMFWTGARLS
jgi:AcrR family transcriptional regulator